MLVLGLNAFHPDSSACILVDGKLVAAVAEERLGQRHRHTAGFPGLAINSVLKAAGATIRDVDYVAVGNDRNANVGAKVSYVLSNPLKSARGVIAHVQRRSQMRGFPEVIAEACGINEADCRFKLVRVEHHLAHIASSYYCSDFDQAAGFSCDAAGDFTSAMFARCKGNHIDILDRVHVPSSLGFFYTALCQFIGFEKLGEEYKVMGLAAYGMPTYLDLMRELLTINARGQFRLDSRYFRHVGKNLEECIDEKGEIVLPPLYTNELAKRLGKPRRRGEALSQRDKDIACSCQAHFEDVVLGRPAPPRAQRPPRDCWRLRPERRMQRTHSPRHSFQEVLHSMCRIG
jgi:carbamoyltransferase